MPRSVSVAGKKLRLKYWFMSADRKEAVEALRQREQELVSILNGSPKVGLDTVMEAMVVGHELGRLQVSSLLLDNDDVAGVVKEAVFDAYPSRRVRNLGTLIASRLSQFDTQEVSKEISSQDAMVIYAASFALANL